MALEIGSRLGHYDVTALIGEGGMGQVYQATDTKLNRQVALKILPEAFAVDPDRLARFQREAQVLASLNHPGIAAIYGLEESDDTRALVLELVEGPTLADRIKQGPIPVDEALPIAKQIAEALEAAHEAGVIHRDLKPPNIKVKAKGQVKVLDFGLAKVISAETPSGDLAQTTTEIAALPGTRAGIILGTAPYMSPEQARGQPLDKRTDIWAFGCVLFEMLTGTSAFAGATLSDTVVRVLDREPDWSLLPPNIPLRVAELLRRCLQKDSQRRCRDIGDVRLDLDETVGLPTAEDRDSGRLSRAAAARHGLSRPVLAGTAAGLVALVVGLMVLLPSDALGPIDSVAVLPFENASTDPDGAYLSDGITENLIYRLSTIPELRVIPRGVAYAYDGATTDLRSAGEELGVRAVVTGRVTERDGILIVRAELTDVGAVSQLWGEQYNRSMADLLAVEEDLVRQISAELRLQLSAEEEQRLTRSDTDNPEAYQLFLKSRHHNLSLSPEGMNLGLEYAQQAVALDPTYALGHAALSDAWVVRTFMGLEPLSAGYDKARVAAERAIALNDTRAYPRLMMGFVKHHAEWDWEGALVEFERALQLEPDSSDAHQSYSEALVSLGRLDEALEHAQRAVELDPLIANATNWLAGVYAFLGRSDDALAMNAAALELDPRHQLARRNRPFLLARVGRDDEAIAELTTQIESSGSDVGTDPRMASLYAQLGRMDDARRILSNLGLDDVQDHAVFGIALARTGELDRAFEALDRAYEEHSPGLHFFPSRVPRETFGGDPRYETLLERMNFPQGARRGPEPSEPAPLP
jgi:TolB-like protein/Flp pilus assembly protein TadD